MFNNENFDSLQFLIVNPETNQNVQKFISTYRKCPNCIDFSEKNGLEIPMCFDAYLQKNYKILQFMVKKNHHILYKEHKDKSLIFFILEDFFMNLDSKRLNGNKQHFLELIEFIFKIPNLNLLHESDYLNKKQELIDIPFIMKSQKSFEMLSKISNQIDLPLLKKVINRHNFCIDSRKAILLEKIILDKTINCNNNNNSRLRKV